MIRGQQINQAMEEFLNKVDSFENLKGVRSQTDLSKAEVIEEVYKSNINLTMISRENSNKYKESQLLTKPMSCSDHTNSTVVIEPPLRQSTDDLSTLQFDNKIYNQKLNKGIKMTQNNKSMPSGIIIQNRYQNNSQNN